MFKRVGNRLIIDFNNCENKKEKIEAMQEVIKAELPTHRAKKVKAGVYEMKFHYKDMPEYMEEMLIKAFKKVDKKREIAQLQNKELG